MIGFVAGIPQLAANQVLLRNRRVIGVDWGAWAGRHPDENQAMLAAVVDLMAAGDLDPVRTDHVPVARRRLGARDLANRKVAGKVRSCRTSARNAGVRQRVVAMPVDLADCSPTWWS